MVYKIVYYFNQQWKKILKRNIVIAWLSLLVIWIHSGVLGPLVYEDFFLIL